MKILVVSQYYSPEPFRINEICEELVLRGNKVTVLTGCPNYPDGEIYTGYKNEGTKEFINGVEVIRCKIHPRKKGPIHLMLNYISFWYEARRYVYFLPDDFDIVYSYQLSPITSSSPANKYSRKHKVPHFLYCLDIWPESIVDNISQKSLIYRYIAWLSKRIYSAANSIGVTSPSFINYLSKLIDRPKKSFVYIPQHARDLSCQNKVVNSASLNILFTGNIGASQNLDVLIDAVAKIRYENNLRITIVGSGSDLERLRKRVTSQGLDNIIVFAGRQPKEKMSEYYAKADFCFLSLRDEGAVSWTIPGKLQEYMSAGMPVLAAINGDARYIIEDSKCGVCVDWNDSAKLASIISDFLHDRSLLSTYGAHARDYYQKHFTLKKHIDSLEAAFNRLVTN